jgi:hypothetical protein
MPLRASHPYLSTCPAPSCSSAGKGSLAVSTHMPPTAVHVSSCTSSSCCRWPMSAVTSLMPDDGSSCVDLGAPSTCHLCAVLHVVMSMSRMWPGDVWDSSEGGPGSGDSCRMMCWPAMLPVMLPVRPRPVMLPGRVVEAVCTQAASPGCCAWNTLMLLAWVVTTSVAASPAAQPGSLFRMSIMSDGKGHPATFTSMAAMRQGTQGDSCRPS